MPCDVIAMAAVYGVQGPLSSMYSVSATPDRLSAAESVTFTDERHHPAALGAGDGAAEVVGEVKSMVMAPTVAEPGLPARSRKVWLTDWLAPSPPTVVSNVAAPSMAESVTSTAVRRQPFALGGGGGVAVVVGEVKSRLIPPTEVEPLLPARSRKVWLTDWPAPAVPTVVSNVFAPSMPESASVASKCTATAVLFQPLAFADVRRDPITAGAVLSIRTMRPCGGSRVPALSDAKYGMIVAPSLVVVVDALAPGEG